MLTHFLCADDPPFNTAEVNWRALKSVGVGRRHLWLISHLSVKATCVLHHLMIAIFFVHNILPHSRTEGYISSLILLPLLLISQKLSPLFCFISCFRSFISSRSLLRSLKSPLCSLPALPVLFLEFNFFNRALITWTSLGNTFLWTGTK